MLPDEIENYLNEIERVLKPGGRCLCTFFILDPAEKIENPAFRFPYDNGSYRTMSRDSRAANVAYQLDYLRAQVEEKRNFDILKIQKGYWRKGNRDKEPEFQDIMVFNRR
jgi:ubiquinone/menaquinone biosynthesis C-methylase UbiE